MSTEFSSASHSDIPVLIVPLGTRYDFTDHPRMLVADNLETEGRHALEAAIYLGTELECAELCHTHVYQLSHGEVQHVVDRVHHAMSLGKLPANPAFSTQSYTAQIHSKIHEDLLYRFHNSLGAHRLGQRYRATLP
ncbi:MAG: hypothetical protein NTX25_09285 [Proteobacteria bacterium]|nr:hypothetical protein [Pseudomonadota bacterium]